MTQEFYICCFRYNGAWEIANHSGNAEMRNKPSYSGHLGVYITPLDEEEEKYWFEDNKDINVWWVAFIPVSYNEETGECS